MPADAAKPHVVLVVEEHSIIREFTSVVLAEDGGWRVVQAANLADAVTLLRTEPEVQLIFLDGTLPGAANALRLVTMQWPGIAVVLTSEGAWPELGELPSSTSLMPKPYSPRTLVETAQRALRARLEPIIVHQSPQRLIA